MMGRFRWLVAAAVLAITLPPSMSSMAQPSSAPAKAASEDVPTVHAIALYDDPKLPADFDHLPYANPDAPKGGTPVTAKDVVFSFRLLRDKGSPFYRAYYASVESVTALDEHTVRFEFSNNQSRELPLILGQLPVLPEHYWKESATSPNRRSTS